MFWQPRLGGCVGRWAGGWSGVSPIHLGLVSVLLIVRCAMDESMQIVPVVS